MGYTSHMVELFICAQFSARSTDQLLTTGMWWFMIIWLGCVGACIGSFLTVVWDRLGTGEGVIFPCSRCPECDHALRWYHNLPVIGWLLLRGRCYDCSAPIPVKHPLVEALFGLVFILIGLATPWL